MAEGGYELDDFNPPVEENAQYNDDAENLGLENYGSPNGTGEDELYEAETGLSATKTQFRNLSGTNLLQNSFLISSTKTINSINFIRYDLGIMDYVTISKEARKKLQTTRGALVNNLAKFC